MTSHVTNLIYINLYKYHIDSQNYSLIILPAMAKYTRYRKYSRRRKGIWSSRISNITGEQLATANSQYVIYYNLCSNPSQSDSTVSNKYTVKNINTQLELSTENEYNNAIENLQAFVCYIPQGYVPTGTPSAYADVPYNHPEWIMAHRFIGSAQSDGNNFFPPLRISSRLARKLDTGDRVVLILLGNNTSGASATLQYRGVVKYVTKAN